MHRALGNLKPPRKFAPSQAAMRLKQQQHRKQPVGTQFRAFSQERTAVGIKNMRIIMTLGVIYGFLFFFPVERSLPNEIDGTFYWGSSTRRGSHTPCA
jgi:hypothetical protein